MPENPTVSRLNSIQTRVAVAVLAIFLLSIWSLSYYASLILRKDMERLLGDQQFSSVSMLAADINEELDVRLESLKTVAITVNPALLESPAALQTVLQERPILQSFFNGGVIVYRRDGMAVAEVPLAAKRVGTHYMDIDTVAAALQEGRSTIGQPVMGKKLLAPVFGMTSPIHDPQGKVIGAISGVTNLSQAGFLDVVSKSRYGKTGGYLLVSPQQRQVVTATDKKRVMEVLPPIGVIPLTDRFMSGYEESGVAVNSQGVEVLASAKGIPVAGWYVAALLPTEEAFAPIRAMQRHVLLATLVLSLLAAVLTWWMLKRQLAPMLATAKVLADMSQSEQTPHPLPITRHDEIGQLIGGFNHLLKTLAQRDEVVMESVERLRAITDNSSSLIFMKDLAGRYLYVNRQYETQFHISNAAIQGKTDYDMFPREMADAYTKLDQEIAQAGKAAEREEQVPHDDGVHTYFAVKFPLRRSTGEIYAVCGIATDITQRKRAEEALRIAAVAFESQEGIMVMDADLRFLRVNQAFTHITGFLPEDVQDARVASLSSDVHDASFYACIWREAQRTGAWQGEIWVKRKDGTNFPSRASITAVKDDAGRITHYVGNFTDATNSQLQEQQRLRNELTHRDALVREVHHRIKNNLQGITGMLRQVAQKRPELAEPINQAIGQVRGISVIHGLQGRASTSTVRLCELTVAIADEIQNLWQTPVALDIPIGWMPCAIAEREAVPIALVLNELILNAVKHRDQEQGPVRIALRKGSQPDVVQITITNAGQQLRVEVRANPSHSGLQLVSALMPQQGASLVTVQRGGEVVTQLELAPPVISLELQKLT